VKQAEIPLKPNEKVMEPVQVKETEKQDIVEPIPEVPAQI